MLDTIRKRKQNFFYSFIILAVVVVMGFFGVSNLNDDKSNKGVAAWVNGEPITQQEFAQVLEYKLSQYQAMLGSQYDEKLLTALQVPKRTLDELVQYKLLSQQAKTLGLLVSDSELADHIRSLPMYQKDGKFDAQTYSKLPNRGLEEKRQRERLQTVRLQNYLANRIKLTPAEIEKHYFLKEAKADLEYAKIDFAGLAPKSPPTPSQLETFLKNTPESEFQLYYDSHKTDFTSKAQVRLKQIRVGIPFKATENVRSEARKKIELLAKETTNANFSEIARQNSDDPYAKKGGEVGWITRGSLEKPLEEALDKLTLNTVSPIIETPFGFFLLQVLEKKEAVLKPLVEAKPAIAEKLFAEKEKQRFAEEKRKNWEAIVAEGKPLDAELKKAKIEIIKTGPFSIGQGLIPKIGQMDTMLDAVFELSKEQPIAKKLFFFQDHYYYLKLISLELPKITDFATKAPSVEKELITTLQGELLNTWIKDLQKQATVKTEITLAGKKQGTPDEEDAEQH